MSGSGPRRFGDESPHAVGIDVGVLVEDLERHLTLEPRIPGAIDLANPTAAKRHANLI